MPSENQGSAWGPGRFARWVEMPHLLHIGGGVSHMTQGAAGRSSTDAPPGGRYIAGNKGSTFRSTSTPAGHKAGIRVADREDRGWREFLDSGLHIGIHPDAFENGMLRVV